jgi:hypothetical protein
MPTLTNNFLGTPGVTLSTTNTSLDGDPFDLINAAGMSGTVIAFADASDLDRQTAETVMSFSTANTLTAPSAVWTTSLGSQTEVWVRFYVMVTVLPTEQPNGVPPYWFHVAHNNAPLVSVGCHDIDFSWPLLVTFASQTGESKSLMTGAMLQTNKWMRFELHVRATSTAGLVEGRYFSPTNADGQVPTSSQSLNVNFPSNAMDMYMVGQGIDRKNIDTTYISGFAIGTDGWFGPAPFRLGKGSPNMNLTNAIAPHQHTW